VDLGILVGPIASHLRSIPLRSGDALLVAAPLHHGYGLVYTIGGLALGGPVVLGAGLDSDALLALIRDSRARVVALLPVHFSRLTAAARASGLLAGAGAQTRTDAAQRFPHLRAVITGAGRLTPAALADGRALFGERIFNLYGTTEAAWAALATPADLRAAPDTVGRPPRGVRLHVVDQAGAPVPRGRTGQILVSGWEPGGRAVTTGDLGHLDVTGRLFLDGRVDDMIVSGGENVYPAPVLAAIEGHPEVAEATLRPVEDAEFGQRFAAVVCRRPGAGLTAEALRAWLRPRVARAEMPREIDVVDDVPRTATGKPRRTGP
jgi:acyl-CoA synthetase (AMP-forming)/AMP-acid ligase II